MVIMSSNGSSPPVRRVSDPVKMSPASNRKDSDADPRSRSMSVARWATPPSWSTSSRHQAGIGSKALSRSLVNSRVISRTAGR